MFPITERWKTGGYGTTMWHHRLGCGHVYSSRRRDDKPSRPCVECVALAQLPPEEPLIELGAVEEPEPIEVPVVPQAQDQTGTIRDAVASALGIASGDVHVTMDGEVCSSALVWLDAASISRLVNDRSAGR